MTLADEIKEVKKECLDDPQKAPSDELSTCEWVIVPLLRQAGYHRHEILPRAADSAGKFPGYTILPGTPHSWYLEAKAWRVDLQNNHVAQAMSDANTPRRRWVVLTNGREWRLYDNHIQGVPEGQRLVAIAHLKDNCALETFLTALGKESVLSGKLDQFVAGERMSEILTSQLAQPDSAVVRAICRTLRNTGKIEGLQPEQVVSYFKQFDFSTSKADVAASPLAAPAHPAPSAPPIREEPRTLSSTSLRLGEWQNLEELHSISRQEGQEAFLGTKPTKVRFPGSPQKDVASWVKLDQEIVRWIGERRELPSLPFRVQERVIGAKGYKYFINDEPKHEKEEMRSDHRREVQLDGQTIYVFVHMNTGRLIKHLHALCKAVGESPSQFFVMLRPEKLPPRKQRS